jgi:hypothetical protein
MYAGQAAVSLRWLLKPFVYLHPNIVNTSHSLHVAVPAIRAKVTHTHIHQRLSQGRAVMYPAEG